MVKRVNGVKMKQKVLCEYLISIDRLKLQVKICLGGCAYFGSSCTDFFVTNVTLISVF